MTKVVTYLFDNMFQGSRKVTFKEKVLVVSVTTVIAVVSLLIIL